MSKRKKYLKGKDAAVMEALGIDYGRKRNIKGIFRL